MQEASDESGLLSDTSSQSTVIRDPGYDLAEGIPWLSSEGESTPG